jgi:hypothetical protein
MRKERLLTHSTIPKIGPIHDNRGRYRPMMQEIDGTEKTNYPQGATNKDRLH